MYTLINVYGFPFQINTAGCGDNEVIMESTSPTGQLRYLTTVRQGDIVSGSLQPKEVGMCCGFTMNYFDFKFQNSCVSVYSKDI